MESTIVRSVLENDLYKFSMSYYYQRTTPEGIGTFSFNDRNGMKGGRPKTRENHTEPNETKQNQTKAIKERKEIERKGIERNEKERDSFLDDNEARETAADHDRVLNAAEDAGFGMSNDVRAELIAMYADHGLQKVLEGLKSCVKHGAPNLAYLEAVLRGEPKKPKAVVPAQNYGQRDYSVEDSMAHMIQMVRSGQDAV